MYGHPAKINYQHAAASANARGRQRSEDYTMSKLSQFIRRNVNSGLMRSIVSYLETVDMPGPAKKAIAMAVIKLAYTKTGGKWDAQIEQMVSGAIEYILAEIREWAKDVSTPVPTTQTTEESEA
jgi:hypothetical protein